MATYKISQLADTNSIEDNDYFPVVDDTENQTKRVDAQVIKQYMTGSVVNSLSASVLSGSDTYTTTLTSSYTTGSDAKLTTLSASFVTGSDAKFTSISASSITANEYNVVTINRTTLSQEGSTKFGDDSGDTHQFSGSMYVSGNVSGSRAEFTSLTGALDWSYVENTPTTLTGYGITDSVTLGTEQTITGRKTFSSAITGSITGSIAEFTEITSSDFNSQTPAVFVNSAGVAGSNSAFTFKTDSSVTGYLFSIKHNTTEQFYLRYDGYAYFNDTITLKNSYLIRQELISGVNTGIWESRLRSAQFSASGSAASDRPAVRIGSQNIDSNERVLSISNGLYNAYYPSQTTTDVVDVYGNGDVDISGSLIANVRVSGSVASPIDATSYTLSSADRGKTLLFSSSATQDITCSSGLDVGYNCTFVQMGSGQLILSGASGVELLNRQSHTGSAGQYAAVSIVVVDTDKIIIAGDTI